MKTKKIKLGLLLVFFVMPLLLPIAGVSAEPKWGPAPPWVSFKVTPSGLHIVKDPMVVTSALPTPVFSGWVIYVCTSDNPKNLPTCFDYSVTAKGLTPKAWYDVKAYPVPGSSDYGVVTSYTLGKLHADKNGEGELSGFYDLSGPAPYEWEITVESASVAILQTHPTDPAGFFVIS